ncbi:MAG: S23 ribosomal protein [Parcubacteria group bacterium GW2011_GWA2_47_12]|uniref:Four helix bundle protein n=1 Tax=Candidatus Sungbacteria bacterium RIFCSPHIGHO2_02_FULL_49_20 TaxID=1802272 RepID=A0A1G2KP12_9BACT|nr:MAG: S23 ribosomal protein [Parcubacteria group bacterium GW2011_GWA2_47_12]OHA01125.1 MAG: four helix bundle protein [Candidatus Sungbacteria bacterium RIFCSPHIGHO2_02_FULL_49_20]
MDKLSNNGKYDLEERTAKFAECIIDFVRTIKQDAVNRRIIDQLVGSAGSTGANYCEAVEAESKKDFIHKVGIVKKEIKETKHWLRLFARANPERAEEMRKFWKEAHELLLIFSKISRSSRGQ